MFCQNCGKPIPDGAAFCTNCGARVVNEPQDTKEVQKLPEGIYLGADGKYRWCYEMNLWKINFQQVILFKVTLFAVVLITAGLMLSDIIGDRNPLETLVQFFPRFLLICLVLFSIGYVIVALINRGKFGMIFTMDDEKIVYSQPKKQFQRQQFINTLDYLLSHDPAITKNCILKYSSSYRDVKNIKLRPKYHVICPNETFIKNQVYVTDEQYEFVSKYLIEHCRGAKIIQLK